MEDKPYVNPFEDVHRKAQASHDHARKVREEDMVVRERNARREATAEDDTKKT
jgi:hypothetical protein